MSNYIDNDYELKNSILQSLWGYKSFTYYPRPDVQNTAGSEYGNLNTVVSKFQQQRSILDTPIMMPCRIQISDKGEPLRYFQLPNEPIIEISGGKKIVETDIDGQDGSFKQLFSTGDYNITIRGIAVNDDFSAQEDYPEEIVRQMRTFYELRTHLAVISPVFTLFNIKYVSIYNFDLIPIEGAPGMQPYEFSCKSDKDFPLILNKSDMI